MAFFEKNKDKIWSKYTLKRTKLHCFKKFSRGSMPSNPPSNAHGFAMRSMSLRDMQIPKSEKKFLAPPLPNPRDAPGYARGFGGILPEKILKWLMHFDELFSSD